MNYQILDLETYKRKSHFEYFSQLAYPYVGVTADVEITEFHAKIKEQRLPFFLRRSVTLIGHTSKKPVFLIIQPQSEPKRRTPPRRDGINARSDHDC